MEKKLLSEISKRQIYRRVQRETEQQFEELFQNPDQPSEEASEPPSILSEPSSPILSQQSQLSLPQNQDFSPLNSQESLPGSSPVRDSALQQSFESSSPVEFEVFGLPKTNISSHKVEGPGTSFSFTTFKTQFKDWASSGNVALTKLSTLIKILKTHDDFKELPNDPRTLLGTPRTTNIKHICGGKFVNFGVANTVAKVLQCEQVLPENVSLLIGIDGLPIAKSSGSQLWPILGQIRSLPHSPVFVIGIYHGYHKPNSSNDFLSDLTQELVELVENGINVDKQRIKLGHIAFVCDVPAKSFILQTKGHAGYSSCTRCDDAGDHENRRVYFSSKSGRPRTHESFVAKSDEDYHIGDTILINIPGLDLVRDLPLDYMHLVCLGVVKKIIKEWLKGGFKYRLSAHQVLDMSKSLRSCAKYVPSEFAREPRGLDDLGRWKATELRQFLLYTGPVVLTKQKYLKPEVVIHFISLSVSLMLLLSPDNCYDYQEYAKNMLEVFVLNFEVIYGKHLISHNVHGLLHLADDVTRFGALDTCSAFQFESFMQFLKSRLRSPNLPLSQIARRIEEQFKSQIKTHAKSKGTSTFKQPHDSGPLLNNCTNPQYKLYITSNFKISCSLQKDSFCMMTDDTIVKVHNFAMNSLKGDIVLIGAKCRKIGDLFIKPLKSSVLGICKLKIQNEELESWSLHSIKKKMCVLPYKNDIFVGIPLLH